MKAALSILLLFSLQALACTDAETWQSSPNAPLVGSSPEQGEDSGFDVDDDDTGAEDDDTSAADEDTGADDDDTISDDDDDTSSDDDDTGIDDEIVLPPSDCPCDFGQLCVSDECVFADTFAVGLLEADTDDGFEASSGTACFWNEDFLGSVIARVGACDLRYFPVESPPQAHFDGLAGSVQVSGGEIAPIVFSGSGALPCLPGNFTGTTDLFSAGQTLQFEGSGGADFPAFSATVPAPSSIQGAPGAIEPGSQITMAWSPSVSDYVELVIAGEDPSSGDGYALVCRVPDTGGYVVPASISAALPADASPWTASFSRNNTAHLEYPSLGIVIDAVVQTSWSVQVP